MNYLKKSMSLNVLFYIISCATLIGIGTGTYLEHSIKGFVGPLIVGLISCGSIYLLRFHHFSKSMIREKARLNKHLLQQKKQIQHYKNYAKSVVFGQEKERRHLALELHNETIQKLIIMGHSLQLMLMDKKKHPEENELHHIQQLIDDSINSIRSLIKKLRPTYIEHLGLHASIRELLNQIASSTNGNMHIELIVQNNIPRMNADIELSLYRIVQSALNNITLYIKASRTYVHFYFKESYVYLEIVDNGTGLNVSDCVQTPTQLDVHYSGLRERALLIDGELEIDSSIGQGTVLRVKVPIAQSNNI